MHKALLIGMLAVLFTPAVQASEDPGAAAAGIIPFSFDVEPITPLPLQVPVDAAKRALGQALFFDQRFSASANRSCGDCHALPALIPDQLPVAVLTGERRGKYPRDMTLLYNVASSFWYNRDGRYAKLERLIEDSISDVDKFNSRWPDVIAKLARGYQVQANKAYGTELTQAVVVDALATFVRSLNAPNAAFDRYLRGDTEALSPRQREGYALFTRIGCSSCHNGRGMGGSFFAQFYIYRHLDAGLNPRLKDFGRYYVTGEESDRNSFRVSSLRNVAVTAPYFHDGSAETLVEAITLMANYQLGLLLTPSETALLVEFLGSLTGNHPGIQPSGVRQ
ncbi:MAG: cytochrome c peroxidase [Motiliproteus sp.]